MLKLAKTEDNKLAKEKTKNLLEFKMNKKIDPKKVPRHIAFIMDGNGRWALRRGFERTVGHRYGYEKMMMVVRRCAQLGIEVSGGGQGN